MNKSSWIALMVIAGVGLGCVADVSAAPNAGQLVAEADKAIKVAEAAVDQARASIENGKALLATIPADSPLMDELTEMLKETKTYWSVAVSALESAKESASKITAASTPEVAQDYQLLARINASVALSGAKVAEIAVDFIEAAANDKTEALDVIREAMAAARKGADQVQLSYERIKGVIADKYSK